MRYPPVIYHPYMLKNKATMSVEMGFAEEHPDVIGLTRACTMWWSSTGSRKHPS